MRPRSFQFRDNTAKPNRRQRAIWRRFEEYADIIARKRERRRLVIVVNGDLIDGDHHNTHQLVTRKESEQAAIFTDAADWFMQRVKFTDTDRLYIMRGTDLNGSHGQAETADRIARDLGAVPELPGKGGAQEFTAEGDAKPDRIRDGWYPWKYLELNILGHLIQITHHPPVSLGRRAHTRGNALRSWLRSYQTERALRGEKIPRFVVVGHGHSAYELAYRMDDGTPDGALTEAIYLPAWQVKTDYVYQRLPFVPPTTIGGWWANFDLDGAVKHRSEFVRLNLERKPERI